MGALPSTRFLVYRTYKLSGNFISMGIKENLKRIREAKGFSQPRLAKESGVSQQLISRLERGVDLTSKRLPELARALGVPVHEIDENFSTKPDSPEMAEAIGLIRTDPAFRDMVSVLLNIHKGAL